MQYNLAIAQRYAEGLFFLNHTVVKSCKQKPPLPKIKTFLHNHQVERYAKFIQASQALYVGSFVMMDLFHKS